MNKVEKTISSKISKHLNIKENEILNVKIVLNVCLDKKKLYEISQIVKTKKVNLLEKFDSNSGNIDDDYIIVCKVQLKYDKTYIAIMIDPNELFYPIYIYDIIEF